MILCLTSIQTILERFAIVNQGNPTTIKYQRVINYAILGAVRPRTAFYVLVTMEVLSQCQLCTDIIIFAQLAVSLKDENNSLSRVNLVSAFPRAVVNWNMRGSSLRVSQVHSR